MSGGNRGSQGKSISRRLGSSTNGHDSASALSDSSHTTAPSTLAAWAIVLCQALQKSGVDPDAALAKVGLSQSWIKSHPDGRVPTETMTKLWQEAEALTGNTAFGLNVAKYIQPLYFRALGVAIMASDTLEDCFQRLSKYHPLISDSVTISLEESGSETAFCIRPMQHVPLADAALDAFMAVLVRFIHDLTQGEVSVNKVELRRQPPQDANEYHTALGHLIDFNASEWRVWLDTQDLKRPLLTRSPEVAAHNDQLVDAYIKKTLQGENWLVQVQAAVEDLIQHGEPTTLMLAERFHMSERSFRRHLKQYDTTFTELLSDLRKAKAKTLIHQKNVPITEIALTLGFNDVSNFGRAFKRWFGCSPSQYRQAHL